MVATQIFFGTFTPKNVGEDDISTLTCAYFFVAGWWKNQIKAEEAAVKAAAKAKGKAKAEEGESQRWKAPHFFCIP